jgi:hypothetical protein
MSTLLSGCVFSFILGIYLRVELLYCRVDIKLNFPSYYQIVLQSASSDTLHQWWSYSSFTFSTVLSYFMANSYIILIVPFLMS